MDFPHSTIDEPATPDFVLAVLRDEHRQWCEFDSECEPSISLSMESTIQDWRAACDLVGWRQLGRALNESWNIDIPANKWKEVLEAARERPLSGVCQLIACHALRQRIHPVTVLGRKCRPAAVFLGLRRLLADGGADASEITPSSPIAPYTRQYPGIFLGEISRLVPGALPPVKIQTPAYDAAFVSLLLGWAISILGFAVGFFTGTYVLAYLGLIFLLLSYLSIHVVAYIKPANVTFGELHTFRDLARAIASSGSNV